MADICLLDGVLQGQKMKNLGRVSGKSFGDRVFKTGFTLIELLVVVLIIGILAAIAVAQYQRAVWRSRAAALQTWSRTLLDAQERYYMANGRYTLCLNLLDVDYASAFPEIVRRETGYYDGGHWAADCVLSVRDGKSPGITLSLETNISRAVFTSGKYMLNGFGVYLSLPAEDRKVGGLSGMCTSYGDGIGWRKILKSMGYTRQVLGNYACYQQTNAQ